MDLKAPHEGADFILVFGEILCALHANGVNNLFPLIFINSQAKENKFNVFAFMLLNHLVCAW